MLRMLLLPRTSRAMSSEAFKVDVKLLAELRKATDLSMSKCAGGDPGNEHD